MIVPQSNAVPASSLPARTVVLGRDGLGFVAKGIFFLAPPASNGIGRIQFLKILLWKPQDVPKFEPKGAFSFQTFQSVGLCPYGFGNFSHYAPRCSMSQRVQEGGERMSGSDWILTTAPPTFRASSWA